MVNYSCNQCGHDRQVESELSHECETTRSPGGAWLQKNWLYLSGLRLSNMEWDGPSWSKMVPGSPRLAKMVPDGQRLYKWTDSLKWSQVIGNDNANLGLIGIWNSGQRALWYQIRKKLSHKELHNFVDLSGPKIFKGKHASLSIHCQGYKLASGHSCANFRRVPNFVDEKELKRSFLLFIKNTLFL